MRSSLSLRLFIAAAITTALALAATALVLNLLFRIYFEERVQDELETYLLLLTGNIGVDQAGNFEVTQLSDPRFAQALSGYYWQIELEGQPPILSPSFWAAPLELSRPEASGSILFQEAMIGTSAPMTAASWVVTLGEGENTKQIFLSVAFDRTDLDVAVFGFKTNSAIWLAVLGVFLLAASWMSVRVGLKPLENVRAEVNRVNRSKDTRLTDNYPVEVRPLVNEVNQLLDQNAQTLAKARSSAGNLAHGLKTPLTIMRSIARDLSKAENHVLAESLNTEIDSMQHIVERELARSRDSRQVRAYAAVAPVANRLRAALGRQPGLEHLRWVIDVPDTFVAPFDEFDLTELLGNLLDNAVKWTRQTVTVRSGVTEGSEFLCVVDDGPGIPKDQQGAVLSRGEKLDPKQPGSGLGLTIVRDMAESHGCMVTLKSVDSSGLEVRLSWPAKSIE